jgi:hypothetical protein
LLFDARKGRRTPLIGIKFVCLFSVTIVMGESGDALAEGNLDRNQERAILLTSSDSSMPSVVCIDFDQVSTRDLLRD